MSSKSPVPSRAALNALRGVLFTTSCSVFLLTEERRRRLNIARAAIENTKKLHTVRNNRGAIALASDVAEEMASPPIVERPLKNSHRRRRRDDFTSCILHDPDFEIHRHGTDCRKLELKIQEVQAAGTDLESELGLLRPLPQPPCHNLSFRPLQFLAPAVFAPTSSSPAFCQTENQGGGDIERTATGPHYAPKTSTPSQSQGPHLPYERTLHSLRGFINDLRSLDETSEARTETLQNAIACLQRLIDLRPSTPIVDDIFKLEGLDVLKRALALDRAQVPAVLRRLCYRAKDRSQILDLFLRWLQETEDPQGVKQLLDFLKDETRGRKRAGGRVLYRILIARSKLEADYKHTKGLYDMLIKAGLFDTNIVPWKMQYMIRQLILSQAFDAGDAVTLEDEMRQLCRMKPESCKSDIKLQGISILHDASCGKWDKVRHALPALTQVVDTKSLDFKKLLFRFTEIFAEAHTAEDLEKLLRNLAGHYKLRMKRRWVVRILNAHASRRETGKMLSWLQFCGDHRAKLDDRFLESYASTCRKYFSFSGNMIKNLFGKLERPVPSGLCSDKIGGQELDTLSRELDSIRWASRADVLQYMQALESHEEWDLLPKAYAKFQQSGLGFSQDILRLGVLGWLKGSNSAGGIGQASALLVEARDQGHDVTGAMTPLLIARIDKGDDPGALIKSALQHGIKVHNSVYNKAAQSTLAQGDAEGAIQLCRLAARENGDRQLLYSEHNFLNLVYAYTSSAQYGELRDVVALFTSGVEWWKGSQRCKMSIKFAMKTAAMRAATNPLWRKRHEEVLFKLDEALVHVRRCRTVVGERRVVTNALIGVVKRQKERKMGVMPRRKVMTRVAEAV